METNIEQQNEFDLSEELRKSMEEEANALQPGTVPRRAFLKRMVQISVPACVLLATAENASACSFWCDESSGCQAGCLFTCDTGACKTCMFNVPPCTADNQLPCDTQAVLCPSNIPCGGIGVLPWNSSEPPSPDLEESQSGSVNKHLGF